MELDEAAVRILAALEEAVSEVQSAVKSLKSILSGRTRAPQSKAVKSRPIGASQRGVGDDDSDDGGSEDESENESDAEEERDAFRDIVV